MHQMNTKYEEGMKWILNMKRDAELEHICVRCLT
ncbi:hypothetical protein V6Z12_D10G280200 [Gossypium hirsutum]